MGTVRNILDRKGWTIHAVGGDVTVFEAIAKMCRVNVGALLVNDVVDQRTGIVTERDIVRRVVLERRDPSFTRVAAIMTRDMATIPLDATTEDAMALMTQRLCHHLPVLQNEAVVGVISMSDLVRWTNRDHAEGMRVLQLYGPGVSPG